MSAAVRLLAHPHTPGGLRAAAPYKLWANSASLSNALGWLFSSIGKLILSHGLQASHGIDRCDRVERSGGGPTLRLRRYLPPPDVTV
jgi:hypothetical protein